MVFNQEYVQSMFYTDRIQITPIFYIGNTSSTAARKRSALNTGITRLTKLQETTIQNSPDAKIEKLLTTVARDIKNNALSAHNQLYRHYNKSNAQSDLDDFHNNVTPVDAKILSPEELHDLLQQKNSDTLPPIKPISLLDTHLENLFSTALTSYKGILSKEPGTIASDFIRSEFKDWVEKGQSLHKEHDLSTCQFCGCLIPASRNKTLEAIFSDAYNSFKAHINTAKEHIFSFILALKELQESQPNALLFFKKLQLHYSSTQTLLNLETTKLIAFFDNALSHLDRKAKHQDIHEDPPYIDLEPLSRTINVLNHYIAKHNSMSHNFDSQISGAQGKIASHFLLENLEDYKTLKHEKKFFISTSFKTRQSAHRASQPAHPRNKRYEGWHHTSQRTHERACRLPWQA